MTVRADDARFTGSISELYESELVPLLFAPYAEDVVDRLSANGLTRVLEIAAGTGVVTRALASALPASVTIVATDLNQTMLDTAAAAGTSRPVEWRRADAMDLPFEDECFDAVVCQFGAMFFPERMTRPCSCIALRTGTSTARPSRTISRVPASARLRDSTRSPRRAEQPPLG